ncbi:MAG: bifunctional phosphopantothenoylcysteine decarboxylase/phosphopantothenate--cysteine ligase CoaBC [Deltaproteobacteria bacterium]|nr:bifunctional phosphopantothenoylcysteine decarboxylase/phosphopantothenate--cysteine ligase CoaBC [Deltaproteobacteria bacterium]MBW2140084.1 bifunctional phosphopantothenoylcysteine decarboxylase/phosphopantothenate--cysteine ligase CoaBC [Deltaproteobacteria bacterium]
MSVFKDKHVVLAVTGGIAAYKSAELTRMFMTEEAMVRVVMTKSACQFITPLTFQSLTRAPVATDLWESEGSVEINHISLADWADVVVIAPATANIIGKMSNGIADDFLSTFLLAVRAPIVICPAMNVNMYNHPVVQENLVRLKSLNYHMVDPGYGALACGTEGQGRLAELEHIVEETRFVMSPQDLTGLTVMVTSGPTRERWDDIRYMSNISSGKMGVALAKNACQRGAEVILVTGPTVLPVPYKIQTIPVGSTVEMQEAVNEHFDRVDVLIGAAAPMDFRPAKRVKGKVKKTEVPAPIELASNPDILAGVGKKKGDKILVGFAAEAENMIKYARGKLEAKNLDFIVANQIGAPGTAFTTDTNQVSIITRAGEVEELPLLPKEEVAGLILDRVLSIVSERRG